MSGRGRGDWTRGAATGAGVVTGRGMRRPGARELNAEGPPHGRGGPSETLAPVSRLGSLDLDGAAGGLEGSLGLLGDVLLDLLENRLRGALDEILGLLQAEAGQSAHLLDDGDLLVATGGEDDIDLAGVGLLGTGIVATASGGRDGLGDGNRSGPG